jgi:DNA-binding response OmpR family regulator
VTTDSGVGGDDADDGDRPVVLAVDDQPRVVEAVALWLGDAYEVHTATSGREALATVDERVDVVLLDRHMPGIDGDEVLDRIAEREIDPRVAMLTAVDPDFDVVEMPFDEYVVKPAGREELHAVVERLLELRSYDETVRELFAVTNKQSVLEAEHPLEELERRPEYRSLTERRERLSAAADDALGELDHETAADSFRDL